MAAWIAFPYDASAYTYDAAALRRNWARLHAGDAEPLPRDERVLAAWALFHAGRFAEAVDAGLSAVAAGVPAGLTVANKALGIYATYLEPSEASKQALFMELAGRAERCTVEDPDDPNGWYCMAYALGRNSQSVSVAKALASGLGMRVKGALEMTIRLAPQHADAHTALGTFHAEVIDKVGALLGRMQGASKDAGLAFHQAALRLNPGSAIAMIEYARGMVMVEGDKRIDQATELYRAAAAVTPMDATERLDVETARAELDE